MLYVQILVDSLAKLTFSAEDLIRKMLDKSYL